MYVITRYALDEHDLHAYKWAETVFYEQSSTKYNINAKIMKAESKKAGKNFKKLYRAVIKAGLNHDLRLHL